MSDWHVYCVRCADGSLYTGITTDVPRRFAEHKGRGPAGAKYPRGRGPLALVFQKRIGSRRLALRVEDRLKRLPKQRKEALIRTRNAMEGFVRRVAEPNPSGNAWRRESGIAIKPSGSRMPRVRNGGAT